MAGFYDQNPVTLRIDKMRMKWNAKVNNPNIRLVRWLIAPDEVRMVEAFSKLEASEFALLPDMFLTMESNFGDYDAYEQSISQEFLARFEDEKALKELETKKIVLNWDHKPYKNKAVPDFFDMMADHLRSFEKFRGNMVIYLKPKQCQSASLLKKWIENRLDNLPKRLRIMVHDYLDGEVFDSLMLGDDRVSIVADLDMPGALKEIIESNAAGGNPRSKFAQCIHGMGQESAKQSLSGVNDWGHKALSIAQKLKDPAMEITLYMAWGINMQTLKEPEETLVYYNKAKDIAATEVTKNEPVFSPLLLQTVSFKAAALFQQKKLKEAAAEYETMAQYAKTYNQPNLEMEAWWQLGEVRKRMDNQPEMLAAFKTAFESGAQMYTATLLSTRYPVIAKNLYDLNEHLDYEYADEVDVKMIALMGKEWQATVSSQYIGAPIQEEEVL